MEYQKFRMIQIAIAALLGILVSMSIVQGNYVMPFIGIAAAMGIVLVAKKKVKEVTVDERDIKIAGMAARMSFSISSVAMALIAIIFMALRDSNPIYYAVASTLSYATCGMLMLYSAFSWYYAKKGL
jgi:uncharacterized membrane protein